MQPEEPVSVEVKVEMPLGTGMAVAAVGQLMEPGAVATGAPGALESLLLRPISKP